jgi:hypothetical protein
MYTKKQSLWTVKDPLDPLKRGIRKLIFKKCPPWPLRLPLKRGIAKR